MDHYLEKPLVSIVIPCYNMQKKISRMLESVLIQTYKNLHVIVVDDGSVDSSKQEIMSYVQKFQNHGIQLEYIYQENKGLGGAVNTGLKRIKGKYFCWPDADDTLTYNSIERRVEFLEKNPSYAFVRSDAYVFFESDLKHPIGKISRNSPNRFKEENLMEDYILENDIIFCPGCHMVKTESFKKVNPQMDIYEGRRGQNYQMLLPLVYRYKFGYIDECLYNYVIYQNSMSRGDDSFEKCLERYDGLQSYILETLNRMEMPKKDFDYYTNLTFEKYYRLKAIKAFEFGLKREYVHYCGQITNNSLLHSMASYNRLMKLPGSCIVIKQFYKMRRHLQSNRTISKLYRRIFNG